MRKTTLTTKIAAGAAAATLSLFAGSGLAMAQEAPADSPAAEQPSEGSGEDVVNPDAPSEEVDESGNDVVNPDAPAEEVPENTPEKPADNGGETEAPADNGGETEAPANNGETADNGESAEAPAETPGEGSEEAVDNSDSASTNGGTEAYTDTTGSTGAATGTSVSTGTGTASASPKLANTGAGVAGLAGLAGLTALAGGGLLIRNRKND